MVFVCQEKQFRGGVPGVKPRGGKSYVHNKRNGWPLGVLFESYRENIAKNHFSMQNKGGTRTEINPKSFSSVACRVSK